MASDIFHSSLSEINPDTPISMIVELGKDLEGAEVSLYYRLSGEANYTEVDFMNIGANAFQLTFSPVIDTESELFYYIHARTVKGEIHTFPEYNPEEIPIAVSVISEDAEKPKINILNPPPNAVISDDQPAILVTFEDDYNQFNYDSLKFMIDGKDLTNKIILNPPFMQYIPQRKLSLGEHKINLTIMDKRGDVYEKKIQYTYQKVKPKIIDISGSVSWDQAFFSTDKVTTSASREPYESKFSTNINLKTKSLKSSIGVKLDNRHSDLIQPLNRLKVKVATKKNAIKLSVGDASPKFSKLSYNAKRANGVDLDLDTLRWLGLKNFLTIKYASGDTKIAIPLHDDVTAGTFRQSMTGYQLGLNFGRLKHKLSYVKVEDDINSLVESGKGTTVPKENHVLSLAADYTIFDQTKLELEAAGSVHYTDSSLGEIDLASLDIGLSQETLEKISNILPLRSSIVPGYAADMRFITPIFTRSLIFKATGQWVNNGFTSLGNTGIKQDNFDYSMGLNSRLFANRLMLSGTYQRQTNNVEFTEDETSFSDIYRVNSSFKFFDLGSISAGFSTTQRNSETNDNSEHSVENSLNTITIGLSNVSFKLFKVEHQLNTNVSTTSFADAKTSTNDFDSKVFGLNSLSALSGTKLRLGYNLSLKEAKTAIPNSTTFQTLSGKVSQDLFNEKLNSYAGLKYTIGKNNGADTSQHIDTTKMLLSLGFRMNLPKYWQFTRTRARVNLDWGQAKDNKAPGDLSKNFADLFLSVRMSASF